MKNVFYILIELVSINVISQNYNKKISIDKSSFGSYPAIIFDIDGGNLIQLDKKENEAVTFNGIEVENGLYIEPNDSEIGCINLKSENGYQKIKNLILNIPN